VVVGGGFTGLWTAYYLLRAQPGLRVVVVEAEIAGFGASGRNGGWVSALFPASTARLVRLHGRERALDLRRAMTDTVDEVGRVAAAEGIDCGYARGGTVGLARTPVQVRRARAEAAADARHDHVDGIEFLDGDAAWSRLAASRLLGGTWTPHCARIQPALLVRGLARAVEARGGVIAEGTRATAVRPGEVVTDGGTVRAGTVVRATEAWTARLPGSRRALVPVYSLMIATEPLPADVWASIGLARGETFNEHRHLIVYGQRTVDDRIAFGGRGAPYHVGSGIQPAFDTDPRVFTALRETLTDILPQVSGHRITHAWGGPLGVPRDWHAGVGLDRRTRVAWAGGYVGDGVGTSNLAGRTIADLVLGRDTDLVRLPWVQHASRDWEPEPLRWLGVNAGLRLAALADAEERLTGRPSVLATPLGRLTGH
jgi:glycine/D-amino acid oxidase-like deaminating enzyme